MAAMSKAFIEWFGIGSVAVLAAVTAAPQFSLVRTTVYAAFARGRVLIARLGWRTLGTAAGRRWIGQELRALSPRSILGAGDGLVRPEVVAFPRIGAPPHAARHAPDGIAAGAPARATARDSLPGPDRGGGPGGAAAGDGGPSEALTRIRSRMDEVSYTPGAPNVLAMTKFRHGDEELSAARGGPAPAPVDPAAAFGWSCRVEAGVTILEVVGILDAVGAEELRREVDAVAARRPPAVVVDLSSLRMIDSSGVGVIVRLFKRCAAFGGTVQVAGLKEQPLAVFKLLRLDRIFALQ
jgi:anti-sigma B factor antagonist